MALSNPIRANKNEYPIRLRRKAFRHFQFHPETEKIKKIFSPKFV
jgi:hypothetical protein